MFGAIGTVQTTLAMGAHVTRLVPCFSERNLLFGKINILAATGANSGHPDLKAKIPKKPEQIVVIHVCQTI